MFNKVLVANRGEIAVRIINACKELKVKTVAVYSKADKDALFVKLADEAYEIGEPDPASSYLNMGKIIDVARRAGAEAIHPGYGFLAENVDFVRACESAGITFIGPSSLSMERAKPKHRGRELARSIGVPVVPGSDGLVGSINEAVEVSENVGYPVLIKPSGGGGGIGMMVAKNESELISAVRYAQSRAKAAFGTAEFYIEKYMPKPRHIEAQILADKWGNMVFLGERECSIQRRYQKLIEEAPSPAVTPELRASIGDAALRIAKELEYVNALTVEFIFSQGKFYFIECNTRLQVEHGVTEMITGVDIVKEQIRIAAGDRLSFAQEDVKLNGWAIECRICAEDPANNFAPCPGRITRYKIPGGSACRVDNGVYEGFTVPMYYDPLIAKLIVWGRNRDEAISRAAKALDEYIVDGIKTNIPLHKRVLSDELFRRGDVDTNFIGERISMEEFNPSIAKLKNALFENVRYSDG